MRYKHHAMKIQRNDINLRIEAYEIIVTNKVFTHQIQYQKERFEAWIHYRLAAADAFVNRRFDNCTPKVVKHCKQVVDHFRAMLRVHSRTAQEIFETFDEEKVAAAIEKERWYGIPYYLDNANCQMWNNLLAKIEENIDHYGDPV